MTITPSSNAYSTKSNSSGIEKCLLIVDSSSPNLFLHQDFIENKLSVHLFAASFAIWKFKYTYRYCIFLFFFYHFCSQIDLFKIAYNPSSRMNLLWTQLYQRTPVCPVYTSWVNATECDINCYTVKVVYTHSTSTLPLYSTVYLTCVNQALGQFIFSIFCIISVLSSFVKKPLVTRVFCIQSCR